MKRILLSLLACSLLLLAGCQSSLDGNKAQPLRTSDMEAAVLPTSGPYNYDGPTNPLTGLPVEADISQNRPFAISLNNIKQAQPQHGVSQADIIYEVLAEGGITRMVALYQDVSDVDVIGSVRSARPYFLDLAQGHDAVFVHAGGSEDAYRAIRNRSVSNIDGVRGDGKMFYRDSYRRSANGYEHSLMTTGSLITELAANYVSRLEHESGYAYQMEFVDDATPEAGNAAADIYVTFSNYKTAGFVYDEEAKLYSVSQYSGAYTDGNTGDQVMVKNVLVLYAATSTLDNEGRLSMNLTGSGGGFFACNGQYVPITWHKNSAESQFTYTLDDGSELCFGRGTSYICIIPNSGSVTFE